MELKLTDIMERDIIIITKLDDNSTAIYVNNEKILVNTKRLVTIRDFINNVLEKGE